MIPIQYALRRRMMGANGQREIQWWWSDGAIFTLDMIDRYLFDNSAGGRFSALAGMTWAEWCSSVYNTTPVEGGWATIYVGKAYDGTPDVVCIGSENNLITYDSGTYVSGNDVIIADYGYGVYMD